MLRRPEPTHALLEAPSPSYSRATVRRALSVWLHCGQRNSFRAVCDYYHRLEALEDQLPEDRRALSRHPELDLFSKQPPTSAYLKENYPRLYAQAHIDKTTLQTLDAMRHGQEVRFDHNKENAFEGYTWNAKARPVIKSERDTKLEKPEVETRQGTGNLTKDAEPVTKRDTGATKQEIVETSQLIGSFCKNSKMALNTFLKQFKEHAVRCQLKDTVLNVGFHIKRKMIHDELLKAAALGDFPNLRKVPLKEEIDTATKTNMNKGESENKRNTYAEATKSEESANINKNAYKLHKALEVDDAGKSMDLVRFKEDEERAEMVGKVWKIRVLKRENAARDCKAAGFQNHLGKVDNLKCRKI